MSGGDLEEMDEGRGRREGDCRERDSEGKNFGVFTSSETWLLHQGKTHFIVTE